jgi:hypothetical protein
MTITNTQNVVRYSGDGTTTTFAIPFVFGPDRGGAGGEPTWIKVYIREDIAGVITESLLTEPTDYTILGGDVTLNVAASTDEEVIIKRVVPLTQLIAFNNSGPFFPETLEEGLDEATMTFHQFDEKLGRTLLFPETSPQGNIFIPDPEQDTLWIWRESGGDYYLENISPTALATEAGALLAANNLSDLANAAVSRGNLGLGSAAVENASAFEPANANIQNHIASTANPHGVTADQVGRNTAQWNADRLQGRDVRNVAPSNGELFEWNNADSRWEPAAGSATARWNASQLQGRNVQNAAPTAGQLLEWNNTDSRWEPAAGAATARWNANQIQGRDVQNVAPAAGQLLRWSGVDSRWEPADPGPATGGYTSPVEATIANDQSVAADVVGMSIVEANFSTAEFVVEIRRKTDDHFRKSVGRLTLTRMNGTWEVVRGVFVGTVDGVVFSAAVVGPDVQVRYTSDDLTGANYEGAIKFARFTFPEVI